MVANRGNRSIWKSLDWFTIAIYIVLMVFGWISVCGASYDFSDMDFFSFESRAGKQLVWMGLSLGIGFVLLMLEERIYEMFAPPVYWMFMGLLIATIFLSHDVKGSRSWLDFGPLRLQPAEFAKFATALYLAKFMNSWGYTIHKFKNFLKTLGIVLLPMAIIIMQKETGSALVYTAFFLVFYREGMAGSVLFSGISAVLYFVVGLRFQADFIEGRSCLALMPTCQSS